MQEAKSNLNERTQLQQVMGYAAQLELEVDRLRRRDQFLQHQATDYVRKIARICDESGGGGDLTNSVGAIRQEIDRYRELLQDMSESPGYHPAFDQVVAIAVQPLAEKVFRWQQRLNGASDAVLRLDLQPDYIEWFPARLRHILDNLVSNALRYRDSQKGEIRVGLALREIESGYQLEFTDNGKGLPRNLAMDSLDLFYRAAPTRAAGLGVGLAVVKLMVEQCCGTISISSGEGRGTNVTVVLPRYDLEDHVD